MAYGTSTLAHPRTTYYSPVVRTVKRRTMMTPATTVDCCLQGRTLFVYIPPERIQHHRAANSSSNTQPWLLLGLGIGLILYAVLAILLWLCGHAQDESIVLSVTSATATTLSLLWLLSMVRDTLRPIIFDRIPNWIASLLVLHVSFLLAYVANLRHRGVVVHSYS